MSLVDVTCHVAYSAGQNRAISAMASFPQGSTDLWLVNSTNLVYRLTSDNVCESVRLQGYNNATHAQFTGICCGLSSESTRQRICLYDYPARTLSCFELHTTTEQEEKKRQRKTSPTTLVCIGQYVFARQELSNLTWDSKRSVVYVAASDGIHVWRPDGMDAEYLLPVFKLLVYPKGQERVRDISGMTYDAVNDSLLIVDGIQCQVRELKLEDVVTFFANEAGKVLLIKEQAGVMTTVCGKPHPDMSRPRTRDGAVSTALLRRPRDIHCDRTGYIYIVDVMDHSIRRINRDRTTLTTIAGNGSSIWNCKKSDYPAPSAAQSKTKQCVSRDLPTSCKATCMANPRLVLVCRNQLWVHCFQSNAESSSWNVQSCLYQIRSVQWEDLEWIEKFIYMSENAEYGVLAGLPIVIIRLIAGFLCPDGSDNAVSEDLKQMIRARARQSVQDLFGGGSAQPIPTFSSFGPSGTSSSVKRARYPFEDSGQSVRTRLKTFF